METILRLCDRVILLDGGTLFSEGGAASVVRDYVRLMDPGRESIAITGAARPESTGAGHLAGLSSEVRRELEAPLPGRHAAGGSRASEITGVAVSDPDGRPAWSVRSGETLCVWVLIEARELGGDLNVGFQFYDRRGILVFAVDTAARGIRLPVLEPGQRLLCGISVVLALHPGEYTLVPRVSELTAEDREIGMLDDQLESLPPLVVARAAPEGAHPPFHGLVNLETDMAWTVELPRSGPRRAAREAGHRP
jgi:hypothetical protein